MERIFHTVVTSERHRQQGFCENSDFGGIEVYIPQDHQWEHIVSFKRYPDDPRTEYILVGNHANFEQNTGMVYRKVTPQTGLPHHSREEEEIQNYLFGNEKAVLDVVLKIRERMTHSYSHVSNHRFVLIGRTLYQEYCEPQYLNITTCGNCMFSHWISIDIENHSGKKGYPLNKKSFQAVKSERKKYWNDTRPKNGRIQGDGHSYFGCPTEIKWGKNFR